MAGLLLDEREKRIYPMRYYAIFLYAGNKQDYIMLFNLLRIDYLTGL
jgi:hypothetical protein